MRPDDDVPPSSPVDPTVSEAGDSTDLEITEGTDPAVIAPARCDATQIAEAPQRLETPHTEFIRFYSPTSADFEGVEAWPAVRGEGVEAWPEVHGDEADAGLRSATSPGTQRTPRQRMLRRVGFAAVLTALVVVIAGSIHSVYHMTLEEPDLEPLKVDEARLPAPPPPVSESTLPRPMPLDEQPPARGLDAEELLALRVQELKDGRTLDLELRASIEAKRVTVVNLWATWCKPCKRELNGLKEMFDAAAWEDQVRFVPLQVADTRDPLWAWDQYAKIMPQSKHFLSDPRSRGGVLDELRELAKPGKHERLDGVEMPRKPEDIKLPVTLVFDCQRDVRLFHVGELREEDLTRMRKLLDTLKGELGTKFCRSKRKQTPPRLLESKTPVAPRCGDGRCEAPESESNCCDCKTCPPTEKCVKPSDPRKEPRCIAPFSR